VENKELTHEIIIYSLAETPTDRSYVFRSNQKAGEKKNRQCGWPREKGKRKKLLLNRVPTEKKKKKKRNWICEQGNNLLLFVPTAFRETGVCVHSLQIYRISSEKHLAKINSFSY